MVFILSKALALCLILSRVDSMSEVIPRTCEPIRIELCRGIGYNETSMPNLLGHELQSDVDFTLQTFAPLIEYRCSAQLNFFLCSAYVPLCTHKVPVPIGPCRQLCETVRSLCHPVLQGFGFPWPAALDCNRFPSENNHEHMCMEGPGGEGPGHINVPTSTTKITSFHQPGCQGLAKSHLYVKLNRLDRCVRLCEADILFDQRNKHVAEMWVSAWSFASLGTAVIAILCLILTDTKRDRILTPLVTCQSLVAIGWTVRFVSGRNSTACGYDPQLPTISLLLVDGLSNASCAATFLLRYYFGMAAAVWWAVLCLEWHRGIRRTRSDLMGPTINGTSRDSNRNIQKKSNNIRSSKNIYSNWAQACAWGIPAIQTCSVLVARIVDADELLGACFVGNQSDKGLKVLVATPLFCYWIFGAVNLFAGYLVHRRNLAYPIVYNSSTPQRNKSGINMAGVGTFLFVYSIPSALLMFAVFYEFANSDVWLNMPPATYESLLSANAPMWPFMTRAFMELLLTVVSSAWVLGPRISTVYKNLCTSKCTQPPTKTAYSTASYQTVRQPSAILSMDRVQHYHSHRHLTPSIYSYRQSVRNSPQSLSQYGRETIL